MRFAVGRPLRAQASAAFDPAQRRQQDTVELAGVCSCHPSVDPKTVGCRGDAAIDELLEQEPDRLRAVRADYGGEVKGGTGHGVSLSAVPGLAAKPIIDMDVVVESCDRVRPVVGRLASIGYPLARRPWRRGQGKPRSRPVATGTCDEGTAARDVLGARRSTAFDPTGEPGVR